MKMIHHQRRQQSQQKSLHCRQIFRQHIFHTNNNSIVGPVEEEEEEIVVLVPTLPVAVVDTSVPVVVCMLRKQQPSPPQIKNWKRVVAVRKWNALLLLLLLRLTIIVLTTTTTSVLIGIHQQQYSSSSTDDVVVMMGTTSVMAFHSTCTPPLQYHSRNNNNHPYHSSFRRQHQPRRQQRRNVPTNDINHHHQHTKLMNTNGDDNNNNISGNFDYEYIPPRTAEEGRQQQQSPSQSSSSPHMQWQPFPLQLQSSYPEGTPAGLRGEAIRSAIRSQHCCIGWNFSRRHRHSSSSSGTLPFQSDGLVQIQSTAVTNDNDDSNTEQPLLQFLNGKFTQYIPTMPTTTTSLFTETSLLNSKGRLMDTIKIAIPPTRKQQPYAYLIPSPGHSSQELFQTLDLYIFPMDQIQLIPKNSYGDNNNNKNACIFSLFSSHLSTIQDCYTRYIVSQLVVVPLQQTTTTTTTTTLPLPHECREIFFTDTTITSTANNDNDNEPLSPQQMTLLIIPSASGLPSCAGYGYTFYFFPTTQTTDKQQRQQQNTSNIGHRIWEYMTSEQCPDGPIEIGTLEYNTLRIECGAPLYNYEMTAKRQGGTMMTNKKKVMEVGVDQSSTDVEPLNDDDQVSNSALTTGVTTANSNTPASPLELGLDYTIDMSKKKGCYQGQEGIASILKNPRGPPRTMYQVIFEDDTNIYDYQSDARDGGTNKMTKEENLTRTPLPNDTLYVLGSNESIMVGRITSVAEPSGTGEPITIALALIRRPDSIQSSMKQMGIEMPLTMNTKTTDVNAIDDDASIFIPPPPLDVLDGLEVIIGNTFTIGTLRMIPSRRRNQNHRNGKFLFSDEDIPSYVQNLPSEKDMYDLIPLTKLQSNTDDEDDYTKTKARTVQNAVILPENDSSMRIVDDNDEQQQRDEEIRRAMVEAEDAANEAQRKAEKLELLRRRAEEAIARRKQKLQ